MRSSRAHTLRACFSQRRYPCTAFVRSVRVKAASVESAQLTEDVETPPPWDIVCPICLKTKLQPQNVSSATSSDLYCSNCDREFAVNDSYNDLTIPAGSKASSYSETQWGGTQLFRRQEVSAVYERGWRQSFAWAGFPGADTEFGYALKYLQPQYGNGIVDLSCGSGLFTRRFLECGHFPSVIALDFSENMLKQTLNFIKEDSSLDTNQVTLIRADINRLPFRTSSVSAMHAGAAIHCWEQPTLALAEISRVLKPGGIFIGSTFLDATAPLGQFLGNDEVVQPLKALDPTRINTYRWWSEPELRSLFESVGLRNFKCQRSFRFILWSVEKPM